MGNENAGFFGKPQPASEGVAEIIQRKRDGLLNIWRSPETYDNTDYRAVTLPNGRSVGDVIRQERQGLLNRWGKALDSVKSYPGDDPVFAPGYALGRTVGQMQKRAASGGAIDFKVNFENPDRKLQEKLGRMGNFAYYAIGDGILPRGLLDIGAAGYAIGKVLSGDKPASQITRPRFIDTSADAVRNKALSLPDDPE